MQKLEDVVILMKNINYIIGSNNIETSALEPFSDCVCDFLAELSSDLMKSTVIRQYPDLSAIAFWARTANIKKMKENYIQNNRIGRGLCFHIAPSNIPINAIFSYIFSLLAGNANIVRLSSKDFPQVNIISNLIKEILVKYPDIEARTAFIKYERDDEISAYFSQCSDCRMIWGGDKTISIFKKYETKPRCVDITFPDRYSVCIINANAILNTTDDKLIRLAENFYNDTYLMDQNACSSPQLIYWLNDNKEARTKFWNFVMTYANQKYILQDAIAVDKYTKMCEDSILYDNLGEITIDTNLLYRAEIKKLNENIANLRGKGGYFYEYSLKETREFYNIVDEKYQTITYYGIDPEIIKEDIKRYHLKGIDRIVPIGQAMNIDIVWDGHNLINELSREISIQ